RPRRRRGHRRNRVDRRQEERRPASIRTGSCHRASSNRTAVTRAIRLGKEKTMPPSVLVTGAGRGIGLAITERLSGRGWDVYATARSADALHRLERLPNVHAILLDINDR